MSMNKEKLKYDFSAYENSVSALAQVIETGILNLVNTCEVVRVLSVNEADNTLTVIPAVKNLTTENIANEESSIYNIKYIGWQFGKCAIQAVPKQNDVGIVVISKRDISNINSGVVQSKRHYNLADGVYIGGLVGFNQTPTEYIKFDDNGIKITSTKDVSVEAKNVSVQAGTKAEVKSPVINIGDASGVINIGGEGGVAIAKQGDRVMAGQTVVGTIEQTGGNVTVLQTI